MVDFPCFKVCTSIVQMMNLFIPIYLNNYIKAILSAGNIVSYIPYL
jgi:hypothetical protein